jgi:hypothetical protein
VRLDEAKGTGSSASAWSTGCFGRLPRSRFAIAVAEKAYESDGLNILRNPGECRFNCASAAGSSPSQTGHASGAMIAGMRLCSSAHNSLGAVVTIAKLRVRSAAGERQFSHNPASAIRPLPRIPHEVPVLMPKPLAT